MNFQIYKPYYKICKKKVLVKKKGSMTLTAQQVQEILADDFLNPNTPEGLLYRVFFQNAIIFA